MLRSAGSRWRRRYLSLSHMVCSGAVKAKWIQFVVNAMRIETENGKCSKLNSQGNSWNSRQGRGVAAIIDTVVPQLSLWALFNATYNIDMDAHYVKSCSYCYCCSSSDNNDDDRKHNLRHFLAIMRCAPPLSTPNPLTATDSIHRSIGPSVCLTCLPPVGSVAAITTQHFKSFSYCPAGSPSWTRLSRLCIINIAIFHMMSANNLLSLKKYIYKCIKNNKVYIHTETFNVEFLFQNISFVIEYILKYIIYMNEY